MLKDLRLLGASGQHLKPRAPGTLGASAWCFSPAVSCLVWSQEVQRHLTGKVGGVGTLKYLLSLTEVKCIVGCQAVRKARPMLTRWKWAHLQQALKKFMISRETLTALV